ncbi:neuroligin-4, X-linked-like [Actinia tenebrosa]|uniref:Neuroligin-4, X-linked-like n=1 Tax=Actinia tenebrosa TaxID=6105 RepID=A0A6P8I913_ACTTE|nr:neuroligin-4, X-linked-like [Actinia tenebrosa]XP_031561587.1 neuroligin-4, X-linked-like [Actinia tenebrosa]XP_031561588.1 neuroligin-4, X-linked-like [Actinia tenebrosa]XP_031561589.1 neuroligin-4, X-linked-like [Actinia tenebrosa]
MAIAMKSYSLVFICICITWEKHCQGESKSSAVIVSTKYGLLKGQTRYFPQPVGNISVVNKFLGVPYAAPPIGELRFLPPQKPKHWKGVYDATRFKPVCYQDPSYNQMFWKKDVNWSQSDDCLYLNVYAPSTTLSHARYPVMVYIHGGGYEAGSPVVSPGDALPMWEVVLVTIQYRLGPFGFISTGDSAAPGNYGMLDQIEALKWIQLTIEAFKGDPSRVTIFGESAGGSSVGLLLLSPLSTGLFHRAIALSGNDFSPFAVNGREEAVGLTQGIAERIKCPIGDNAKMISCMRRADANSIWLSHDANKWRPVVDGIFLEDTPQNIRKANKSHPYPLIVGLTSNEGAYFLAERVYNNIDSTTFRSYLMAFFGDISRYSRKWRPFDVSESLKDAIVFQYTPWPDTKNITRLRRGLIDMITDYSIAAPAHAVLDLHTNAAPGYLFVFSHRSKLTNLPSWKGATHKDDTPYEFGFPFMNLTVLQHYDEHDKNVSSIMITLFTNFARTGNPTPQPVAGCTWTPFNENNNPYLNITAKPEMRNNFHIRNIAFWNKYYPKVLNFTSCKKTNVRASTSGNSRSYRLDFQHLLTLMIISFIVGMQYL